MRFSRFPQQFSAAEERGQLSGFKSSRCCATERESSRSRENILLTLIKLFNRMEKSKEENSLIASAFSPLECEKGGNKGGGGGLRV